MCLWIISINPMIVFLRKICQLVWNSLIWADVTAGKTMKLVLARTSKIKSIVNIYACNFGERFPADESRSRFFFCFLVRAVMLALSKPLSLMPPQRHLPCQGSSACLKSRQIRQNRAQWPTLNCKLRSSPTTVCKCSSISPSRAHKCKVMRRQKKHLPLGVAYLQPWRHPYPASLQTDSKQCFKETQHRVKRLNLVCKSSPWPASYRIFQIRTISLHLGNLRAQIFWCKNSTRLPENIFTKLSQNHAFNISSCPAWPWTNLDQHQDQSLPPRLPPSLQLF